MTNDRGRVPEAEPEARTRPETRRRYRKPRLVRRGDVRTNVLGSSPGVGDSPIGRFGT